MRALILKQTDSPLVLDEVTEPVPVHGEVVVNLRAAALNHRDVWIRKGQYARIRLPAILGSDGSGFIGDRPVVINPGMNWGNDPEVQSGDFHILGMPTSGTFAQRVVVPESQVYPMPDHLSFEEAAAIPLAGVTAFRAAVRQGRLASGQRMLITGIGGGVALWAMQFGLALGAEVWVTSGDAAKLDQAIRLGARGGALYSSPDWLDSLASAGGFDLIVDGAGGPGLTSLLKFVHPGGRVVVYGGTTGNWSAISPQLVFWRQIHIIGSTMGNPEDFGNMMALIREHRIVPVLDRFYDLADGNDAFARMADGAQFGKIILQIPV